MRRHRAAVASWRPSITSGYWPRTTRTCTGSHIITSAQAAAGSLTNTAQLTAPLLETTPASVTMDTSVIDQPTDPSPSKPVKPVRPHVVLPNTGADVQPWMLLVGLLLALAGAMLIVQAKKENP